MYMMMLIVSGCAGAIINSLSKSSITGENYSEIENHLKPPTDNKGRLYVYRSIDSTKNKFVYGIGVQKNYTFCTVDDNAFQIIWEAFKYFDLPEGQHEVTCGNDILKIDNSWSGTHHYMKGSNSINITISNSLETFLRVDWIKDKPFFKPVIVSKEQGQKELMNLPHQEKPFGVYGKGGKTN